MLYENNAELLKMAGDPHVFLLKCAVQNYAWGTVGQASEVAKLLQSAEGVLIDPEAHYAELWMGAHPSGPSMVNIPGIPHVPLSDWIGSHPQCVGSVVNDYFKGKLPFLFKVLSVTKSLSIQAHPNKAHAETLHNERPDIYKDSNHKPEMAIALTPFEALCGFRPIGEVAEYVQNIEELRNVIGSSNVAELISASHSSHAMQHRESLKACFTAMMNNNEATIQEELSSLVNKLVEMDSKGYDIKPFNGELLLKLHREFPGDVGGFTIYFLNHIQLKAGEAMFLEANLPHAYLSGDTMECMACSDNVVRAGLTPKFRDVHTLCEMLQYSGKPAKENLFQGSQGDKFTTLFRPNVPDFAVAQIQIPDGVPEYKLPELKSASICIVCTGECVASNPTVDAPIQMRKGSVIFISANETVELKAISSGLYMFRAFAGL